MLGAPSITTREVWIVCHGYAQLATRFIQRFTPIAAAHRVIVAPEALSRFYTDRTPGEHSAGSQVGATWMTVEDRDTEIVDYVAYLDALHDEIFSQIDAPQVCLRVLGFSQGTATVARWLAHGETVADQLILWAGSLPPDLDADKAARLAARTPVLVVAGRNDEYVTPERISTELARFARLGLRYRLIEFDGAHEIDSATLEAIAAEPLTASAR